MTTAIAGSTAQLYQRAIEQLIEGQESLPSLPSLTLQVRTAATHPNCSVNNLAKLITKDPSLTILLIRHANSPLYRTQEPAQSLDAAIRVLGIPQVVNIIMSHSLNSLFVASKPKLKGLFALTWKRLTLQACLARYIAQRCRYSDPEEIFSASMMSEVGSLALFSAVGKVDTVPDQATFLQLNRLHGRRLSIHILRRWRLSESLQEIAQQSGQWTTLEQDASAVMRPMDLVNLGVYHRQLLLNKQLPLPPLQTLACHSRLPRHLQKIADNGGLACVKADLKDIVGAAKAFEAS